jgi:hypothetical protein
MQWKSKALACGRKEQHRNPAIQAKGFDVGVGMMGVLKINQWQWDERLPEHSPVGLMWPFGKVTTT